MQSVNEKRFDKFWLNCTILFVILLVLERGYTRELFFLKNCIPILIFWSDVIIGLPIIRWIRKRFFGIEESLHTFFTDLLIIAKSLFLSILIFGNLFSWTFKFIDYKYTDNSALIFQRCRVYKIIKPPSRARSVPYHIEFNFMDKDRRVSISSLDENMKQAYKSKNYDNCYIDIKLKKDLLTSYVIEDWLFIADN